MSPAGESERSRIGILRAVAVLILAAALLFPGPAGAAVVIEGAPPWLRERMERSAASVWSEIRQDGSLSAGDSLRLLSLVAERVFAGFAVEDSFFRGEDAVLRIKPLAGTVPWRVEIFPPQLASPVDGWFRESVSGIGERIRDHLGNLPLEALSWADSPLKELIDTLCTPGLPGWSASLLVRLEQEGPVLRVSFVPKPPFVLAVVPRVSSDTLPVMLRSDLNENILRTLSPVVGLPIEWVSAHRDKVEKMAAESLRQTNIVGTPGPRWRCPSSLHKLQRQTHLWTARNIPSGPGWQRTPVPTPSTRRSAFTWDGSFCPYRGGTWSSTVNGSCPPTIFPSRAGGAFDGAHGKTYWRVLSGLSPETSPGTVSGLKGAYGPRTCGGGSARTETTTWGSGTG